MLINCLYISIIFFVYDFHKIWDVCAKNFLYSLFLLLLIMFTKFAIYLSAKNLIYTWVNSIFLLESIMTIHDDQKHQGIQNCHEDIENREKSIKRVGQ